MLQMMTIDDDEYDDVPATESLTIQVFGTIPNFANEKEPKRNFCGHVQPLLCFPHLNYISVQVDFYFFV